ncbi:MAG: PQQ-dependent sugar dehydrogenase [Bacteroidota bacterium]|nr:PQQ-dependent sugar dehydrogenase [Bacteroidota bacterium]
MINSICKMACIIVVLAVSSAASAQTKTATAATKSANAGLTLPAGFSASVLAQDLSQPRHIVVNKNGDVFVKLARLKNGAGIMEINSKTGGIKKAFGDFGGTGIVIKNGFLYASSNTSIYRYKLNAQEEVDNDAKPELIVQGLLDRRQHETKSIALDNAGNIYVNIGAYSNSCQEHDRENGSKGMDPCPILDSAGGIWQFKADKLNQTYGDGVRYATGTRNVVGLDWNTEVNELFVMQHGRDQIGTMFPQFYEARHADELPAEEMFEVKKGMNFGWPYCYYDPFLNKKMLAPEYGGDGKTVGRCAEMQNPVVAFPAHMAPNGLLFYTGNMFPAKYKNGAFVAFHGSWNRNITGQEGYMVAFVPFKNGKPSGKWEVFANGFSGVAKVVSTRDAQHRPCGLAQAPDGSLYITDDNKGFLYRITYKG